jgi:hypothetical protein
MATITANRRGLGLTYRHLGDQGEERGKNTNSKPGMIGAVGLALEVKLTLTKGPDWRI